MVHIIIFRSVLFFSQNNVGDIFSSLYKQEIKLILFHLTLHFEDSNYMKSSTLILHLHRSQFPITHKFTLAIFISYSIQSTHLFFGLPYILIGTPNIMYTCKRYTFYIHFHNTSTIFESSLFITYLSHHRLFSLIFFTITIH